MLPGGSVFSFRSDPINDAADYTPVSPGEVLERVRDVDHSMSNEPSNSPLRRDPLKENVPLRRRQSERATGWLEPFGNEQRSLQSRWFLLLSRGFTLGDSESVVPHRAGSVCA
jgi:hypothetical protein